NCSPPQTDLILKVTLPESDLEKSFSYWYNLLGMKVYEKDEKKQRTLLKELSGDLIKWENWGILTLLVSPDTLGKATVQVIILPDPDGHEICFVGDEAF
ncbi:hypothetical protein Celaphus_00009231, partial [Cervus elaphus hippelaphus]